MNNIKLIEKMVASVKEIPNTGDVIALRQYSLDEHEQRAKRFLSTVVEAFNLSLDRGDWTAQENRTLIHLPLGASAVIHHASGALDFKSGLRPMESLFKKAEDVKALRRKMGKIADRLKINQWLGDKQALDLERLWQIKAAAADPNGKAVEPVLCRVVAAYRHIVNGLPVLGPASVAIKVAGDGVLDALTVQLREPTGEVLDRVEILQPEQAAHQIALQLEALMGKSKISLDEVAQPEWMYLGYLSLSKRKTQRLLAPVYVSAITIQGQQEAQGYVLVTSATEKVYLPLCLSGDQAYSRAARSTGNGQNKRQIDTGVKELAA